MIKGALFDMDGVLLDSETMYIETDHDAAALQGFELTKAMFLHVTGKNDIAAQEIIEGYFGDGFDHDTFRAASDAMVEQYIADGRLKTKPGLRALLPWLKARGIKAAVATSNDKDTARQLLGAVGLYDDFDAVVSGDMVGPSKPAPDIFIAAAGALGLPPEECIAVEDSHPGVQSAAAAGCITVMVPDKSPATDEVRALCAAVLGTLAELPAFIEDYDARA